MGEIKKRWYVIRAISGKEKKVKEREKNYLNLSINNILVCYLFNRLHLYGSKNLPFQIPKLLFLAYISASTYFFEYFL